jgi:hypothetical protein
MTQEIQKSDQQHELLSPVPQAGADLSIFVPALNKWIENQSEATRLNHEIEKEELSVVRESNKFSYRLLTLIVVGVFLLSAGLIFWMKQLDAGLLILSHVGAVIAGLLAGSGLERRRGKTSEEKT